MNELEILLCGRPVVQGSAKRALENIGKTIQAFATRSLAFLKGPATDDVYRLGPFCARVLLENSCTALVGRLDPFRLLYLNEFQSKNEYDVGRRVKTAFQWTGDVFSSEKPNTQLWNAEYDHSKISRSLFSPYTEEICWKPAIEGMLDFIASKDANEALAPLIAYDPKDFLSELRGRSMQVYSTLSKGVHWEIFSSDILLDEPTVKQNIGEVFSIITQLGLVSHFIPTAHASISSEEALTAYIAVQGILV